MTHSAYESRKSSTNKIAAVWHSLSAGVLGALALAAGPAAPVFKHDEVSFGSLLWRALWGLALIAVVTVGAALFAKRFVPGIRGYTADGKRRIQLIESRRVSQRLTLHLVAYEDREILLAQSGDQLLELDARPAKAANAQGFPNG
jgi:hypothetical protein